MIIGILPNVNSIKLNRDSNSVISVRFHTKKARGDLWGLSCPRKLALAICIHQEQFGSFPERLALPKPDEEILSGYEEGVRDGFLAWVKADPETILRRHVVDARGLYPAFREEPARRYGPSSQQCQLNDEVPKRLTEQRRLSVYNWTMRNLSWEGERRREKRGGSCREYILHRDNSTEDTRTNRMEMGSSR